MWDSDLWALMCRQPNSHPKKKAKTGTTNPLEGFLVNEDYLNICVVLGFDWSKIFKSLITGFTMHTPRSCSLGALGCFG